MRGNGRLPVLMLTFGGLGLFGTIGSTLVPAVRPMFGLGLSAAMAVQWVPLIGGGIFALPMGSVLTRWGAVRTMLAGLGLSILGCLVLGGAGLATAAQSGTYAEVLVGLFVLSTGATALQVAINPLVLDSGPPETGPSRLVLAQAANSLGVWLGVQLSSALVLGRVTDRPGSAAAVAEGLAQAYLVCASMLAAVLLFARVAFRRDGETGGADNSSAAATETVGQANAWRCPWALAGALAIALYVGAEGTIGSLLVSYLHQPEALGLPLAVAGLWLANGYWGCAALSRLGGAMLLRRMPAAPLLAGAALFAAAGCLVAASGRGAPAGFGAMSTGLANGVMFPLVFAVTLRRTRAAVAKVSAMLVLAISGGALVSILAGQVAERHGLAHAFWVPLAGYVFLLGFAIAAWRPDGSPAAGLSHAE